MDPIPGLDSPEPARTRADSLFRMDITPVRTNQVNLFFSPAQEDDEGQVAEGSYVRKTGQVPEVYTRTARRTVVEDEDESDDDRRRPEEPPSKKQRTTAGPSNAAARLAASRRALNPTSALSLFDDHDQANDNPAASAQYPPTGDQMETFDPLKGPVGMMSGTAGGADDDATDKRKRTRPKLDAERLLGDRGLPALVKDAKRFRVRGKGHEAKDLANLLSMYQMWTHQMFPKMAFVETVERVESLCHAKVVKSALVGYKEKDKELRDALFRSPTPPATTLPPSADPSTSVNRPESVPGASAMPEVGMDMDMEEEDYEAMIAAAEHEATAAQSRLTGSASAEKSGRAENNTEEEEDFEAMIAAAEIEAEEAHRAAGTGAVATVAATNGKAAVPGPEPGDEYDDDWAAMDGL